jgi:hypothetical protein
MAAEYFQGLPKPVPAMPRKHRDGNFFDGLTRPSMRLLVRIYQFDGAPHGPTISGLVQYWLARSPSWRAGTNEARGSVEALTQRFRSAGLCEVDGSLLQAMSQ